jgi:2-oxo-3-hexenedioate decarboxylase
MSLDQATIEALAEHLETAELERREVTKITDRHPEMDWDDAYAVQEAIRARKAARGGGLSGLKMGLTSQAKWDQMGVREPIHGFLPDYGAVADGGIVDTSALIHPKVEAEIAFILKGELTGPDCTVEQVLAATESVLPAMEVIDSRYLNFQFDMKSVIADNTSAARFVVGAEPRSPVGIDLPNLMLEMRKNGEVVATAAASEVLGDPALSVAMLANMLWRRGRTLPAGTLIMTGGATAAIPAAKGDTFELRCEGLGTTSFHFG